MIELKTKKGAKPVEITARLVKIRDKMIAIQCIARDATIRVEMERELKETRDLLDIILSNIDESILVVNRNYEISKIKIKNNNKEKGIIGKSCYEYLHNLANRCTQYPCPVERVFETGKPFSTTHVHFIEGQPHIVEIEAYPLYDSRGVVIKVIKVMRDVTIKRELERQARESKEFLDQVIENAYDIIFALDCEGKFKLINQAAEKITGYKREEWIGKPFSEIIASGYLSIALDKFKRALNGREVKPFEIEINSKDGKRIPLEINARPIRQDGKISSVVCIARDIAERKTEQKVEEYASQ